MSNVTAKETTAPQPQTDLYKERRKKQRVQNGKTCGHIAMYVGSALIVTNAIQPAREKRHNSLANACIVGAGAMLSIALGKIASNILDKTVDKSVEFFDDINPKSFVKTKEETKDG